MKNFKEIAEQYLGYNLSILGVEKIGNTDVSQQKRPWHKWKELQTKKATLKQAIHFLENSKRVGIACGLASMNTEVIDVDDSSIWDDFYADLLAYFDYQSHLIKVIKTKKGYHIYFRNQFDMTDPPEDVSNYGNQVLARHKKDSDNNRLPRIETRGQGGYVVAPPSEGYSFMNGSDFSDIPNWTIADREAVFAIARSYNLDYEEAHSLKSDRSNYEYKNTPWDEYNRDPSFPWIKDLIAKGWKVIPSPDKSKIYFLRPGDSTAEQSGNYHIEKGIFWVWSTSSEFESSKAYTPALLKCQLTYGKIDAESLAKNVADLLELGYGQKWNNHEKGAINQATDILKNNEGMSNEMLMKLMRTNIDKFHLVEDAPVIQIAKKKLKSKEFNKVDIKNKKISFISNFLKKNGFRKNVVTQVLEYPNGISFRDSDMDEYFLQMSNEMRIDDKIFKKVANSLNFVENFHPLKEFFDNLEPINNSTSHIDKLFDAIELNCDESYIPMFRVLFKKFMIQFIASSNQYGPLDISLILSGGKSVGKTYFLENLLPAPLKKYIAVLSNFLKKEEDNNQLFGMKLLVIRDDIQGTGTNDVGYIKSILSRNTITYRSPYGAKIEDQKRYAILAATSNDNDVLSSEKENRRFVPLAINKIDYDAYNEVIEDENYNIWREIKGIWESVGDGTKSPLDVKAKRALWKVSPEEIKFLSGLNEFKEINIYEETILKHFGVPEKEEGSNLFKIYNDFGQEAFVNKDQVFVTYADILDTLSYSRHIRMDQSKIGNALKDLGFEKDRIRLKGDKNKTTVYYAYKKSDEIKNSIQEDPEAVSDNSESEVEEDLPF